MIQIKWQANLQPLDDLIAFVDAFDEINVEIGEEVVSAIEPFLLDELHYYPGEVKYPIQWTSERQRKAFFATDGFGAGIPYRRTGRLRDAWRVVSDVQGGAFTMRVENDADSARFVVGSLAQNVSAAQRFQQRFHANTGWPLATETVAFWLDAAQEEYQRILRDRLDEMGTPAFSRQAYASPRRR